MKAKVVTENKRSSLFKIKGEIVDVGKVEEGRSYGFLDTPRNRELIDRHFTHWLSEIIHSSWDDGELVGFRAGVFQLQADDNEAASMFLKGEEEL